MGSMQATKCGTGEPNLADEIQQRLSRYAIADKLRRSLDNSDLLAPRIIYRPTAHSPDKRTDINGPRGDPFGHHVVKQHGPVVSDQGPQERMPVTHGAHRLHPSQGFSPKLH